MRQEIARANKFALDTTVLTNEVTRMSHEEVSRVPPEGILSRQPKSTHFIWLNNKCYCDSLCVGVYIYGLYLDGAGWDKKAGRLMEPPAKMLYTSLPIVHLSACCTTGQSPAGTSAIGYSCPVYKKPSRTDLNFIFPLLLKTNRDPSYWILRGVALLCDIK